MKQKVKIIALTILVYGLPILLWSIIPFTKNMWGSFTSDTIFNYLFYGKITYSAMGIIFDFFLLYCIYLLFRKEKDPEGTHEQERVYLISSGFKKIFSFIFINKIKKELQISREEKISLLFYLVKLYFTPVMIGFLIGNTASFIQFLSNPNSFEFTKINILGTYFHLIFYLILVLDTLIFSFGYIFESPLLKSVVKSVEPTAFGWIVAIICYPPINSLTGNIFGWYSSDFSNFNNININLIAALLSLILFSIYVWASVALGFKASNLTNREIVPRVLINM